MNKVPFGVLVHTNQDARSGIPGGTPLRPHDRMTAMSETAAPARRRRLVPRDLALRRLAAAGGGVGRQVPVPAAD